MASLAECEPLPVSQARAGSPEAWDTLFRRYQRPLYAYVFELVHHEQASLDIVQEAFISATRNLGGLREDQKFGGWLFGIAHQKCIQRWRRLGREVPLDDDPGELAHEGCGFAEAPDELLIREEQESEFMKLVNQLPPLQRSVLLLHVLEDFPLEEIATITSAPLGTVKSRLFHAKKALRQLVAQNA